ncbi:MAG: hypothetical protein ABWX83_14150 [Luteibacter sp.]
MSETLLYTEALHVALLRRTRLIPPETRIEARRRVLIVLAFVWLPLALLSLVEWLGRGNAQASGFFTDIAAQARFFLAVPLLVLADYTVLPRLDQMASFFLRSSLIPLAERARFILLVDSTRRLSAGVWPSATVSLIAYGFIATTAFVVPTGEWASWQFVPGHPGRSLPGWWLLLVSMPVLLGLMLSWVWRWVLWLRVLWRLSRMGLTLVSSHPDRAGGIAFLAESPRAFIPLVLPVSIVVAATLAHSLLIDGTTAIGHEATPLITAVLVVVVFASPLLMFTRVMLAARHIGTRAYGELARRMGLVFERRWLDENRTVDDDTLEKPDFSSTTDLYGIVSNVVGMRLLLVDYPTLVAVAITAVLPFVPLWLAAVPFQTLVDKVVGMLV